MGQNLIYNMSTKKISFLTVCDTSHPSNNEDYNSFLTYKEEIPVGNTNYSSNEQSYINNLYDNGKRESQYNIEYGKNSFQNSNVDNESENIPNEIYYTTNKKIKKKLKKLFSVQEPQKRRRGKQSIRIKKKIHNSSDFDNLQSKIQIHFISFIIHISNDALTAYFGRKNNTYNFKDISHEIKKKINIKYCEGFKNSTIKDILLKPISPKYKRFGEDINKNILNKVCNQSIWLNKFFNMKYLKLFNIYYNKEKPLKEFIFEGKRIILSGLTKSFYYLLEKNENLKTKLGETAISVYFYGYETLIGKDSFIVDKNGIELNEENLMVLI